MPEKNRCYICVSDYIILHQEVLVFRLITFQTDPTCQMWISQPWQWFGWILGVSSYPPWTLQTSAAHHPQTAGGHSPWAMIWVKPWVQNGWLKYVKNHGFLGPKVWIHIHLNETVGPGHSSDHVDQWGVSQRIFWHKSNYPLAHWDRFVHQSQDHKK